MTSQLMHDQLNYIIINGKSSIISKDGVNDPSRLHFKITGFIYFPEINAPFLNFSNEDPLVVPPSGNINRGKYLPVLSIKSYLSLIKLKTYFLFSSDPPLGIYIESIVLAILLINGAFLN